MSDAPISADLLQFMRSVCAVLQREGGEPVIRIIAEGDTVLEAFKQKQDPRVTALALMMSRKLSKAPPGLAELIEYQRLVAQDAKSCEPSTRLSHAMMAAQAGSVEIDWSNGTSFEVTLDTDLSVADAHRCRHGLYACTVCRPGPGKLIDN